MHSFAADKLPPALDLQRHFLCSAPHLLSDRCFLDLKQDEKRALDARKVLHIRELKRVAHEDRSKFARRPTLSGRYARP